MLSVDSDNALATLMPGGRGWLQTTAAVHAANSIITIAPRFPRAQIIRYLNETIDAVFPDVYAVGSTEIVYTGSQVTYPLSATAGEVLGVNWKLTGPSGVW